MIGPKQMSKLRVPFIHLVKLIMKILTRVAVYGKEHLPRSGAAILVTNHLGHLDGALVMAGIDRKDITGWIAEKYQEVPFIRLVASILDAEFIDRFNANTFAIRKGLQFLKEGKLVGIAPEGTRSPTHALIEGKMGVAYLASKTGVPVIPAGLTIPQDAIKQFLRLQRPKMSISFGEPFTLPKFNRATRTKDLQNATEEIMCRIAAQLPPQYRGVYSDHPRLKALLKEAEIR